MLQPRHQKIIDLLTSNAPKRFSIDEISKHTGVSIKTVRNEISLVMHAEPTIQRSVNAKQFYYYVGSSSDQPTPVVEPLSRDQCWTVIVAASKSNYEPRIAKLVWNLKWAMVKTLHNAHNPETYSAKTLKKQVLELAHATETYLDVLRSLLATEPLWEDDPSDFLLSGLSEEHRKNVAELSSLATEDYAKLLASKQDQPPQPKDTDDHH